VSFIAKRAVSRWPFVSALARLQRTVFVDRERRGAVGDTTNEIMTRLGQGDTVVLFAEGTSSDGNRVLPFKTSLFGAAKPSSKSNAQPHDVVVQTISMVYTRLHGVPFGRADRPLVGWYGDMEMQSHAWQLLKAGPLDVRIRIGDPIPLDSFTDRKDLARKSEDQVREHVVRLLRGRPDGEAVTVAAPPPELRQAAAPRGTSQTWQ
jgi:1-acyl-sn-glycerol-3-phosphate acyltransferase